MNQPFVPEDFIVPDAIVTDRFQIRLLVTADLALDYEAYMTSIDHVQKCFDPNESPWPTKDFSVRDAMADLCYCEWEHYKRMSFSYGVFSLDGTRELGCIYLHQTWKPDCDTQLFVWARQSELESGFEDELFAFAKDWVNRDWPSMRVTCPGRDDSWDMCARPLLVPKDFIVPESVEFDGLNIRLATMDDFVADYQAYMSNIDHIRGVFGPNEIDWPSPDITPHLALANLGWCEWEHAQRSSFSYGVMTSDNTRELGRLYVNPTAKAGYDAEIYSWVVKDEYDKGLDKKLHDFARSWLEQAWPFERVAFPGREVSWDAWAAVPEA